MDLNLSDGLYLECDRCREACGDPDPDTLCYYHKKIHKGLIDEPDFEVAYTERDLSDYNALRRFTQHAEKIVGSYPNLNQIFGSDGSEEALQYVLERFEGFLTLSRKDDVDFDNMAVTYIRSRLLNFIRKAQLHNQRTENIITVIAEDSDLMADSAPNAEELMIKREEYAKLYDTIEQLGFSDMDKDILNSRMLDDSPDSLQEIADRYDLSREAVRLREKRIIQTLAEIYNE